MSGNGEPVRGRRCRVRARTACGLEDRVAEPAVAVPTYDTVSTMKYVRKFCPTPVGRLQLVASERGLAAILWENDNPSRVRFGGTVESGQHPVLDETERQLGEYFAGTRRSFDLPLDFAGTDFQRRVWSALLRIPYGETRTYGELAAEIGKPAAVRAVGAANGRNPLSIVAPCHRVIGATGHLTGFAGGLPVKARLLELEAASPEAREHL